MSADESTITMPDISSLPLNVQHTLSAGGVPKGRAMSQLVALCADHLLSISARPTPKQYRLFYELLLSRYPQLTTPGLGSNPTVADKCVILNNFE